MNVFCDLLQLSLPIRHDPRWSRGGAGSVEMHGDQLLAALDDNSDWDIDESVIAGLTGFGLSARDVQIAADGTVSVTRLQFNWDSLPSSYTGIGVRIAGRHRGRGDSAAAAPRAILRASPAKILQGHNAYSDIFSLSDAALILIERAFLACPELADLCDPADALVDELHVTGGWRCATPVQVGQILERLRSYRYRHWRAADTAEAEHGRGLSGYKTSLYFSPSSEYHRGVLYQKGPECARQLGEAERQLARDPKNPHYAERVKILSNADLLADADRTLRAEGRWMRRGIQHHLEARGIEWDGTLMQLIDIERELADTERGPAENFFYRLWAKSWRPVIQQLSAGDPDMDLTDTAAVVARLHAELDTFDSLGRRRTGAANRAKNFLMACVAYGWNTATDPAMGGMPAATVSRAVADLELVGITRAQLQDLDGTAQSRRDASVVVSLRRVLEISAIDEAPAWFKSVDRKASLEALMQAQQPRVVGSDCAPAFPDIDHDAPGSAPSLGTIQAPAYIDDSAAEFMRGIELRAEAEPETATVFDLAVARASAGRDRQMDQFTV